MEGEWFRRFDSAGRYSRPEATRLVCFPHAGGAAGSFLPPAWALRPDLDLLAVQYPGRQDRRAEGAFTDIGRLADALADQVAARIEAPYAFFGHSMGALLAYETAARLDGCRRTGPAAPVLSSRPAPGLHSGRHDRLKTDDEILAAVRRLGGTTPQVLEDPEIRDMVLPALRADYRAIGSYVPRPRKPLDVPFTVLIGADDPVVTVAEADGWADFSVAATRLHVFTGGHFFLFADAHVPEVARTVVVAVRGAASATAQSP